jgi:formylglycine-generating enzyme
MKTAAKHAERPEHPADARKACCIRRVRAGAREVGSYDPSQPRAKIPRKAKGGSHLCAPIVRLRVMQGSRASVSSDAKV